MEACWAENAASRPHFESVKKLLEKAFPRRKQMLESMVKNLEQYSQLLERQVTSTFSIRIFPFHLVRKVRLFIFRNHAPRVYFK